MVRRHSLSPTSPRSGCERCRSLLIVGAALRARVSRTSHSHPPAPHAAQEERLSKEVFKWSEMRVLLTLPVIMVRARPVQWRAPRAVLLRNRSPSVDRTRCNPVYGKIV